MQTEKLLSVDVFCASHHIETSFIALLQQADLIEVITIEQTLFIAPHELAQLEKIVRLYYDLDINVEGIASILHLLHKIEVMQQNIVLLQNKMQALL